MHIMHNYCNAEHLSTLRLMRLLIYEIDIDLFNAHFFCIIIVNVQSKLYLAFSYN